MSGITVAAPAVKPVSKEIISEKKRIPPLVSLAAGGIAGGVEAASTYPFEFAKTRVQLHTTADAPRNPFSVVRQVVATEGIGAIYTGCSTLVVGTIFKAAVRFLSFDTIRNALSDDSGRLSPARGMVAGMVAGSVESVVAVTPTERIKTALIDDAKGPKRMTSFPQATRLLVQEQGIAGLYKGLIPTTVKQSATSAVRMGSYNVIRQLFKDNNIPVNGVTTFGMGAMAGFITVYATQPFDSVKTRVQSASGTTMSQALSSIIRERGIMGFWSGSTMRLGRLLFSGGIVFSVYEHLSALLMSVKKDN